MNGTALRTTWCNEPISNFDCLVFSEQYLPLYIYLPTVNVINETVKPMELLCIDWHNVTDSCNIYIALEHDQPQSPKALIHLLKCQCCLVHSDVLVTYVREIRV